jgi:iron complex outermembrane recepter protein
VGGDHQEEVRVLIDPGRETTGHFDNGFVVGPIKADGSHFDWKVGLDYRLTGDVLAHGSISTGYRPPAYNPRPFSAAQAVEVGGEEMTAYELGVKADWLDRTLRLNVAVFCSDWNKRIVPIGGTDCRGSPTLGVDPTTRGAMTDSAGLICIAPTSLASYQQLRQTKVKGVEVELAWRPVADFMLTGNQQLRFQSGR